MAIAAAAPSHGAALIFSCSYRLHLKKTAGQGYTEGRPPIPAGDMARGATKVVIQHSSSSPLTGYAPPPPPNRHCPTCWAPTQFSVTFSVSPWFMLLNAAAILVLRPESVRHSSMFRGRGEQQQIHCYTGSAPSLSLCPRQCKIIQDCAVFV